MDLFSIYLNRELRVIITESDDILPECVLATALKNLELLGYTFSTRLIDMLSTWEQESFVLWVERVMEELRYMTGAHPMGNFSVPTYPDQLMNIHESELYLNALMHYWTLHKQESKLDERTLWVGQTRLRVIDIGHPSDFHRIGLNLLAGQMPRSPVAREQFIWFATEYDGWDLFELDQILVKENAAVYCAAWLRTGRASLAHFQRYLRTATDILRLAAACSDGDVSLKRNTRFRSFNRSERRLLLALLESVPEPLEELFRYKGRWLRLAERLHPGEYRQRYPKAVKAIEQLRSGERPFTFSGRVEHAFKQMDRSLILTTLAERPDEMVRQLDRMIRSGVAVRDVVSKLEVVADRLSTPALLHVLTHFRTRVNVQERRCFFPKGNTAKLYVSAQTLPPMDAQDVHVVISAVEDVLLKRFAKLPSFGNVYIDERLQDYTIPQGSRSVSKSHKFLSRGSWVPLPAGDTVRFFIWWREGGGATVSTGRVKIALCCVVYDSDWHALDQVSYAHPKSDNVQALHSGDIVVVPDGAAEYIDIHMPSARAFGARYIVLMVNLVADHPLNDLSEVYAGWMMRKAPQPGDIFEVSPVQDRIDLAMGAHIGMPAIIDLQERRILWCDLGQKQFPSIQNDVESKKSGIASIARAMTELRRPDLYTLFMLHATARGRLVETLGAANVVFTAELESNRVAEVAEYLTEGPAVDRTVITPLAQERILEHFL
ncbi:TerD family protein [Paenibacillus pabuli]|uniref:TerD family protein n=1 Tax=Paenibacillus pabuli TaxID=1472 RepID=UPI0007802662|nr:TerD family protein [Paenibacillus pabuli]MEC0127354.1 TerD family protein [Paenibacillus pabuli]